MRGGRVAAAAIMSVALSTTACSNVRKQDVGAMIGLVVGAAVGAAIGDGAGQAAATLVGGLAGGIIGSMIGAELDEADRIKKAHAAQLAAAAPDGSRINWQSGTNPKVHGYAEPVGSPQSGSGSSAAPPLAYCFDPQLNLAYRSSIARCHGTDRQITAAEFENRSSAKTASVPVTSQPSTPVAAKGCRKVREVVFIEGSERSEQAEYCWRGTSWERA
jgi:surface antigen